MNETQKQNKMKNYDIGYPKDSCRNGNRTKILKDVGPISVFTANLFLSYLCPKCPIEATLLFYGQFFLITCISGSLSSPHDQAVKFSCQRILTIQNTGHEE